MKQLDCRKTATDVFVILLGMGLTAISIHFFLKPSGLIVGSTSGLAIIIETLTGIPISIVTFLINIVLLVVANFLIGKEFGGKTIFASLILSPFLWLCERFFPKQPSIMQDPWLDLLCFVLILSFAQALLFRINASTGGLDIVAKLLNKFCHIEMGTAVTISGFVISLTAFAINDTRMVIIGLIGTYLNGLVIDQFSVGFGSKKRACIISDRHEEIQDYIVHTLHRGVTLYRVTGGYKNEERIELQTILTRSEFSKLMEKLQSEHYNCFITAGNINEVYGYWIDNSKNKVKKRMTI